MAAAADADKFRLLSLARSTISSKAAIFEV